MYEALEFFGSQPRFAEAGPITGEAVYIRLACDEATTENAEDFPEGGVAIARRGECLFATKLATAAALGADAIVIANNVGDTAWGGIRIWDYADPENPVLASTFNTVCSAAPNDPSCDPAGTYSVHNVQVASRGNKTFAYVSWYWDGMLVLHVTTPTTPSRWPASSTTPRSSSKQTAATPTTSGACTRSRTSRGSSARTATAASTSSS